MGDGNVEQIVLEADEIGVVQGVAKANAALASLGQKSDSTGKLMVRTSDNTRNGIERLISSFEKQNAVYGKSPIDQLIAKHDQLNKRLGNNVDAVNRSNTAFGEMKKKMEEAQGSRWDQFGDKLKSSLEHPLQAAGEAAKGLLEKIGPVGSIVATAGAAIVATGVAAFSAAKSLGEYGTEIHNVALRTGLTTKEVGQFSFAAKVAGQDVSVFERAMKGLTVAVEDNSSKGEAGRKWLTQFGVDLRSVKDGSAGTAEVLLRISEGLNGLGSAFERNKAQLDIFKKAGIEMVPAMMGLVENLERAKELGLGSSEDAIKRFEEYHEKVVEIETVWNRVVRAIKQATVEAVAFFLTGRPDPAKDAAAANKAKAAYETSQVGDRKLGVMSPGTLELYVTWQKALAAATSSAASSRPFGEQWLPAGSLNSGPNKIRTPRTMLTPDELMRRSIPGLPGELSPEGQKKLDRARDDAAVSAFGAGQGVAGQLKIAEKKFGELGSPSTAAEVATYTTAEHLVDALKRQIEDGKKATQERARFITEVSGFEKKGEEAELDAIGKIYYQRDLLIKQAGTMKAVESEIAGIRKSAGEQASAVFKSDWEKFETYDRTRRDKQMEGVIAGMGPSKGQTKEALEGFAAEDEIAGIELRSRKDTLTRNAGRADRMVGLNGLSGVDAIRAAYRIRIALANELAKVEDERIEKETNAAQKLIDTAKARSDVEKARAEASEDASLKLAELDHQHFEEAKNRSEQRFESLKRESEGLWNTLFTRPRELGSQLLSTLKAAVLKPITEGLGGMTANVLKPIIYGANGEGGIAGMFHGIFGGANRGISDVQLVNGAVPVVIMGAGGGSSGGGAGSGGGVTSGIASFTHRLAKMGISLPVAAAIAMGASGGGGSTGGGGYATSALIHYADGTTENAGGGTGSFGPSLNALGSIAGIGGTGGFAGGYGGPGGGGQSSGGNPLSNILGSLKGGLKGIDWGHFHGGSSGTAGVNGQPGTDEGPAGATGMLNAAIGAGGMALAQQGLLGSSRGTWGGVGMGALGGAMVGFSLGLGPVGAAIGGGVGLLIGLGEKIAGVETPERQAARLIRSIYGLQINDNSSTIKQVVAMAKQSYGGDMGVAVRSPQVRELLQLYADSTGQKSSLLTAQQMHSASLAESGGALYQQATYQNGTPYTYASSLPTLGPSGGQIPTSYPSGGTTTISLNPQQTVDLWRTGTTAAIQGNSRGVAEAALNGNGASATRLGSAGLAADPGAIWA